MFFSPYLKYFRAHRGRIAIAMIGMFVVGAFTAAPILVGREAIDLLLRIDRANAARDGAPAPATTARDDLIGTLTAPAAVDDPDAAPSFGKQVDGWLARNLGGVYREPRDWLVDRATRTVQWYREAGTRRPMTALGVMVGLLCLMIMIKGLAQFVSKYQMAYTFFWSMLELREDLLAHLLRQDYLFFNRHTPGYLQSRVASDVKAIQTVLQTMLTDGVQQPITIVFMLAMLIYLSWQLTLGVFVVLPLIVGILYLVARSLRRSTKKAKEKGDQLSSRLMESLTNIRLIKAFGTEGLEVGKFRDAAVQVFRYLMRQSVTRFASSPLMEFVGSLAFGGVLIIGGWMIMRPGGGMNLADFTVFVWTLSRFYRPLKSLAGLTGKYQEAKVSMERMSEILALAPKVIQSRHARPFERLEDRIELRGVGFSYDTRRILEGIDMTVQRGRRVAFVGETGSGKTTLVNMIARLFDPSEGVILVDGVDLRELRIEDWRRHLAIVTQDTFLFDDTIANNIAYGMADVDRPRIEAAARAANAHEFIMELDGGEGYDTRIGPTGARLSGGQRQRLAIARAIYRDPEILILDEATSALDVKAQAVVQESLARLMRGRTTFVIAHRISTVRDVDCIYVLGEGRILEAGSHDALVAAGSHYARMVARTGLVRETAAAE